MFFFNASLTAVAPAVIKLLTVFKTMSSVSKWTSFYESFSRLRSNVVIVLLTFNASLNALVPFVPASFPVEYKSMNCFVPKKHRICEQTVNKEFHQWFVFLQSFAQSNHAVIMDIIFYSLECPHLLRSCFHCHSFNYSYHWCATSEEKYLPSKHHPMLPLLYHQSCWLQ